MRSSSVLMLIAAACAMACSYFVFLICLSLNPVTTGKDTSKPVLHWLTLALTIIAFALVAATDAHAEKATAHWETAGSKGGVCTSY